MVIKSDTTTIVTAPKLEIAAEPSLKRWLKHFFYMPESKRFFNRQDQYAITQAVTEAEQGHVGEIQVVIEGHIPAHQAYVQNVQARARQLFAELGVWDTEYNSGVLLYINYANGMLKSSLTVVLNMRQYKQIGNKFVNALQQT